MPVRTPGGYEIVMVLPRLPSFVCILIDYMLNYSQSRVNLSEMMLCQL